jgi:prepilin-type N-terminal cleavage/methylation domain-containing protein
VQRQTCGFTIVELIVVVILLGILSMTAISRLVQPSAFSPRLMTEAFSSASHHASQLAVTDTPLVSLEVTGGADDYVFAVRKGVALRRNMRVERDNLTLIVSNNGALIGPIEGADSLIINLAADGDVASATFAGVPLDPSAGIELSVQGLVKPLRCLHPSGYVAETGC